MQIKCDNYIININYQNLVTMCVTITSLCTEKN